MGRRPKLFDFSREEIEKSFQESVSAVLAGEDLVDPRPAFDEKQAREIAAAQAGGRVAEAYTRVLEAHGFVLVPARRLPRFYGVVPQAEGRWTLDGLQMGFYPSDLPKQFPEGPEQFDTWIKQEKAKRRLVAKRVPKAEIAKILRPRRAS
jgi:hypothetical protein